MAKPLTVYKDYLFTLFMSMGKTQQHWMKHKIYENTLTKQKTTHLRKTNKQWHHMLYVLSLMSNFKGLPVHIFCVHFQFAH